MPQLKTMETFSVSCNKSTGNANSTFKRTKQNRLLCISNCFVCSKKKSKFIKRQEDHQTTFFWIKFKINKIVNKIVLLAGDKFTPKLDLKRPEFAYSGCGPFIKDCEKIQKFRETGNFITEVN